MSALVLRGLRKSFGEVGALRGVDLLVPDGELVSLVGPSGCGKTTTLRLIAGLEGPDAGTIELGGLDLVGIPTEDRGIGFVFQGQALFPHLDVGRNIAYGLRRLARTERRRRVEELLDLVGLRRLAGRRPGTLSAGERQRVAVARALAPRPGILLLDEPLSALDVPLRDALQEEVCAIQRELKVSTIYVTHDQAEALSVADRVAVMNAGKIEQEAPPADVYLRPQTSFVASFIGRSNRLQGEVIEAAGDVRQARVGGAELAFCSRDTGLGLGSRVVLFVKEEDVRLIEPRRGRLAGRVAGLSYYGEVFSVRLETPIGLLRARVPAAVGEGLRVDQTVAIELGLEKVAAFRSDREGGEAASAG